MHLYIFMSYRLKRTGFPPALRALAQMNKRAALLDSSVFTVKKQHTYQDPLPGALSSPPPLSIARRVYPDYTTCSYFEAIRVAWAVKRSTLPNVGSLGPDIVRVIVDFLLTLTPALSPIRARAMERKRRLERLADLLDNSDRRADRE